MFPFYFIPSKHQIQTAINQLKTCAAWYAARLLQGDISSGLWYGSQIVMDVLCINDKCVLTIMDDSWNPIKSHDGIERDW